MAIIADTFDREPGNIDWSSAPEGQLIDWALIGNRDAAAELARRLPDERSGERQPEFMIVNGQLVRFNPYHDPKTGKFTSGKLGAGDVAGLLSKADSGGFTYRVADHTSPAGGYAFSPYPKRSRVVPTAELTGDALRKYARDNADLLSRPGHFMGAWRERNDVDRVWLDVSIVAPALKTAARVGREHNQIAAFDLANGTEVPLGGTGEA